MNWETRVMRRLTPGRDAQILLDVYEHGVLTTGHIDLLHFGGRGRQSKACYRRLSILEGELRVLERFRPPGARLAEEWHYTLSPRGAKVVGRILGEEVRAPGWQRSDSLALLRALPHRRASIDFFCAMTSGGRRHLAPVRVEEDKLHRAQPDEPATLWLGERSCRRLLAGPGIRPYGLKTALVPDGLAMLEFGDRWAIVLLELDRGTEASRRLDDKLARYAWLPAEAVVLFCFTEASKARGWRPGPASVRVLIGDLDRHLADPWGEVWREPASERTLCLPDVVAGAAR